MVRRGRDEATDSKADPDAAYRELLVRLRVEAQDKYDKAVLTLSGGALGVSFAFIKDVVGARPLGPIVCLLGAWLSWATSVGAILWSFYTSRAAMQSAIDALDAETPEGQPAKLSSTSNELTKWLNRVAGIGFVVGVVAMAVFATLTLEG